MKMHNLRLLFLGVSLLSCLNTRAQEDGVGGGGGTPPMNCTGCTTTSINISTGYDFPSNSYTNPTALESNWKLVAVPSNAPYTIPPSAPTWVVVPYASGWGALPNARWISPFQNASYTTNNYPPATYGTFDFQKCFCVCQSSTVNINFAILFDDIAVVYLDGNPILAPGGIHWGNGQQVNYNNNFYLTAGQHCLTVKLVNSGGVVMGFDLEGAITGTNLMSPACCNPTGRICGTKMNDLDCSGSVDPATDPGLAGWTIELRNSLGAVIATAVTNNQGCYCFDNLPAGSYTVNEVNQTGWTQLYPGGSGVHNITLTAGQTATADFGNCDSRYAPPCAYRIDFSETINNCLVNFNSLITGMAVGYDVVSSNWTFGDGYSSTQLNPTHAFAAPGTYNVCFEVTIYNSQTQICCTKSICKNITIENSCSGICQFDIIPNSYDFNEANCSYTFHPAVTSVSMPITGWFWDFGDGTTGTGYPITHQFPTAGVVYHVCVTVFGTLNRSCCNQTFCFDIATNCDPCNTGGGGWNQKTGKTTPGKETPGMQAAPLKADMKALVTDKNTIVLNQNVPNPFAESTVITFNIPSAFKKAQLLFTTNDGKTIKTIDIKEKGKGQYTVFADDLTSGLYHYALVVDGKVIDSKNMVKK